MKPALVTTTEDAAEWLRAKREALGLSGEALDARVGWPDRYTAKAENPGSRWAKRLIRIADMGELWLQGLDAALIIADRQDALRFVEGHIDSEIQHHGVRRVRKLVLTMG